MPEEKKKDSRQPRKKKGKATTHEGLGVSALGRQMVNGEGGGDSPRSLGKGGGHHCGEIADPSNLGSNPYSTKLTSLTSEEDFPCLPSKGKERRSLLAIGNQTQPEVVTSTEGRKKKTEREDLVQPGEK